MRLGQYTQEKHKEISKAAIKSSIFYENKIINLSILISYISFPIVITLYYIKKGYGVIIFILLAYILLTLLGKVYTTKKDKKSQKTLYIFDLRYSEFLHMKKGFCFDLIEKELKEIKKFRDINMKPNTTYFIKLLPFSVTLIPYIFSMILFLYPLLKSDIDKLDEALYIIIYSIYFFSIYIFVFSVKNIFYSSECERYAEMNYFLIRYKYESKEPTI